MDAQELQMPHHHQMIMNRFVAAGQVDERVVAAFISGSYARGTTDIYSDLDFGLIITDEAYDDFFAEREAFIRLLGEPVFLEDYNGDGADFVFSIFSDGTEVELGFGHERHFNHIYVGPYRVLLDKKGILAGAVFSWQEPSYDEQIETLRGMINWFWHDLSHHFITPMARGQLWSAYGALEDLRLTCVNMARLRQNFSAKAEGYGYRPYRCLMIYILAVIGFTLAHYIVGAVAGQPLTFLNALAVSVQSLHGRLFSFESTNPQTLLNTI